MNLTLARQVIDAARQRAEELDVRISVAVVDSGANPLATARMDGAQLGSYQLALDKAWTAVAFEAPTESWSEDTAPGAAAWGFSTVLGGRVVVFAGGVPLLEEGRLVGGVGVSGSSATIDGECARSAAEVISCHG